METPINLFYSDRAHSIAATVLHDFLNLIERSSGKYNSLQFLKKYEQFIDDVNLDQGGSEFIFKYSPSIQFIYKCSGNIPSRESIIIESDLMDNLIAWDIFDNNIKSPRFLFNRKKYGLSKVTFETVEDNLSNSYAYDGVADSLKRNGLISSVYTFENASIKITVNEPEPHNGEEYSHQRAEKEITDVFTELYRAIQEISSYIDKNGTYLSPGVRLKLKIVEKNILLYCNLSHEHCETVPWIVFRGERLLLTSIDSMLGGFVRGIKADTKFNFTKLG